MFAVIDWHYRFQRPQHLASELVASGHRVFYISNNFLAGHRPGFLVEPLDDEGCLYQVFLQLRGAPDIYFEMPTKAQQAQLREGVGMLLSWARSQGIVALIQHPFWAGLVQAIPNARLIYDCMDHHEGFGTFGESMIAAERTLMARADLVIVSSAVLEKRVAPFAPARALIRNAADFAHFSQAPPAVFHDPKGRRILGYYGAIATWFDLDLVEALAMRFPDCLVLLIGHDQIRAERRLAGLDNVAFVGEVAYRDLPYYLHGFDVCILPFLVNDLTRATNPVKVYEYLSAGKTVVAVDLPELGAFDALVVAAPNRADFLDAVGQALSNPPDYETIARRRAFAAAQTWAERGRRLNEAIETIPKRRPPAENAGDPAAVSNRPLPLPTVLEGILRYLPRAEHVLRTEGPLALWRKVRRRLGTTAFKVPRKPHLLDLREPFSPITFTRHEAPEVSVIIPVFNKFRFTHHCLAALAAAGDCRTFEVLVVDDGSVDGTSDKLAAYAGVRVIVNEDNLGFIGSSNRGASFACGEYLVFLNNDTQVQPGWLDALIGTFEQFPGAGVVGSRLVYPDGRLQEAGGIVFADGSAWNYGHLDDPYKPDYSYLREPDYLSGASLAIRRDLFERLGGFDALYAPAYYEDADLAFRVRAAGYRVYYQPQSNVVHFEGVTAGIDESAPGGMKGYQSVNRKVFLDRWRRELESHGNRGERLELQKERHVRRRAFVADVYMVTPDRESGSLRMFNVFSILQGLGFKVTFAAANLEAPEPYVSDLQGLGVEVLYRPYVKSVENHLKSFGEIYDLVMLSRADTAAQLLGPARRYCSNARIVFDTVDLHFLREMRLADLTGDEATRAVAERRKHQELSLIAEADTTLVVSTAERDLLAEEAPNAEVHVVSNIHRIVGSSTPFPQRHGVLFIGAFAHPPNTDAVLWFCRDILPLVLEKEPGMQLYVIGADPPETVKTLASENVRVLGHVPDVGPYLDGCRLSVAPLRYGAGVKGKVNQSLAYGLPVVATTQATEGMFLQDGQSVLVADLPRDFADAVLRLYGDRDLWERLSRGGIAVMEAHFSVEAARRALADVVGA